MAKTPLNPAFQKIPIFSNVNGGVDGAKVFGFSWTSGMEAAAIASIAACAVSGPICLLF